MEAFFIQNYNLITRFFEILAVVTGLWYFKKYRETSAKYFIYFLVYAFLVDFIGAYPDHFNNFKFLNKFQTLIQGTKYQYNVWWFTLFWDIGAVLFFAFYYHNILKSTLFKNMVKMLSFLFIGYTVYYLMFHWNDLFIKTLPVICILGGVIILLCVILYFIEMLLSDKVITFYKSLNFYISVAIFIWWLIVTPIVFYDIYNSTADWNFVFLKWQIYLFANIFMYSTFSVGLMVSNSESN
ncbi:MAG TPA: hypothetical protein VKY41_08375 [Xanthomarina sp.]|nr:hypothetical protein [Xanthomarina sp.]